jgi:hypothetical protein
MVDSARGLAHDPSRQRILVGYSINEGRHRH